MKTQRFATSAAVTFFMLLFSISSFASFGGGSIIGQVTDPATKEPLAFATVVLECQGSQHIYTTNEFGYYYASNLPQGNYTIKVSYQSSVFTAPDLKLSSDDNLTYNISVGSTIQLSTIEFIAKAGKKVLFDPADPQKVVLDGPEMRKMPVIGVGGITEIQSGIIAIDGEYYVRGARAGSLSYYIDGCKVMGSSDIPVRGLDTYRSYTGFIPPKYGDSTGGVIAMETRNYFSE